tara:strand:- start:192589 stop:192879 length:291 start_codon:yes stop_codon:yes gene_type:complete
VVLGDGTTGDGTIGDGTIGATADSDMDGEGTTTLGTEAHGDGADTMAVDGADTVMDGEDTTIHGMAHGTMVMPIMVITEIEIMPTIEEDEGIIITT